MNFPRTVALAAAALLTLPAISAAQDVQFYQKASEAHAPITGNVAMRLTLSPKGETSNVRVIRSSGSAAIDKAAVAWMNGQIMRPVFINGEASEFSFVKEIKFSEAGAQLSMK